MTEMTSVGRDYSMTRLIVYVDNHGRSCPCEERDEHTSDGSWILYRCIYCHDKELKETCCLGTTQYGIRCRSKYLDYDGYCRQHQLNAGDRLLSGLSKVDISLEYDWHDHYRRLTAAQVKRTILRSLQLAVEIRQFELADILDQMRTNRKFVYFILCKNYVKVGKSNNPESRLKTLQNKGNRTLRPKDITDEDMKTAKIIATVPGDELLEGFLHSKLRGKHAAGEWFFMDSYTAKVIQETQNKEFSLKSLIEMAAEDSSILNQDSPYSHRRDESIDEVLQEEEDRYPYLKECVKEDLKVSKV